MLTKWVHQLYQFECDLFLSVNNRYDRVFLNVFFRNITHLGGATATISIPLLLILFFDSQVRNWGIASAASLLFSHLFVVFMKKIYPRARPYLSVSNARVGENPLKDHSFPSGHTTAIFSIITPFILHMPILSMILYPLAACVGISRVFLGLHYPSDVLAGVFVGTVFGFLAVYLF